MKGIFVKLEKDEIKDVVADMLEADVSLINLISSTFQLKKIRKEKIKLEREFLMATEELDLDLEKLKAFFPEVEFKVGRSKFKFEPGKPTPKIETKKERKAKHEVELEAIRARIDSLRKK